MHNSTKRAAPGGVPALASGLPPHALRTPLPSIARERWVRVVALVVIGYGLWFEAWRWAYTLNPDALWLAIPLALAETLVLFSLMLTTFEAWHLRRREPPAAPPGLDVDVFITTYDEPLEIIRRTANAARDIEYPHRTWILDDGRRFEVRVLARELGIGYRTRPDNTHAKAGNLNAALAATTGEFILQLDADHVPLPHILHRLLGYFTDPQIAFVQSPQSFYNLDAFGTHVEPETRRVLTDQALFFDVLQPGKDAREAAFFCGSCGVLRRSAIEQLGGFSTETITEDIETSLRLHGLGWRSAYHNEPLAYGLAPRTATAFQIQRLRWAQGAMQLLRRFNPLTHPGLSRAQRLCYLSSVLHPLEGAVRLVFIVAPLCFLGFGVFPVRADGAEFVLRFLPFAAGLLLLHRLLGRGTIGPIWFLDFGSMSRFFIHLAALPAVLARRRLRFRVTPKGLNGVAWTSYAPQLAIVLATLLALVWSVFAYRTGRLAYHGSGGSIGPYLLNVGWAAWNMAIAAIVLRASIRSHQRRPDHRFEDFLPITFAIMEGENAGEERAGITENLTPRGLALRAVRPLAVGARVTTILPLVTGPVEVAGEVVYRRTQRAGRIPYHSHGIRFDPLAALDVDAIDTHCTQFSAPMLLTRYVERSDTLAELRRFLRDARGEHRFHVLLPAWIRCDDGAFTGVMEDASRGGARILLDRPLDVGLPVSFGVADTTLRGPGFVTRCTELSTAFGTRWIIGIRRSADAREFPIRMNRRATMLRKAAVITGLLTAVRRMAPVIALMLPVGAQAQVTAGLLSGAERDSEGQSFYLLGGWIGRAGSGLNPVAGVIAYRLGLPDGGPVLRSANPFIGVRHQGQRAGLQASVGYAWRDEDGGTIATAAARRVTAGVTSTAQADYAGNDRTASVIASYAWGDGGYLWSRGRIAQRVLGSETRALRFGAEMTAQGGGGFSAYEAGPLLEWAAADGIQLVLAGGFRRVDIDGAEADDPGYLRLELVYFR